MTDSLTTMMDAARALALIMNRADADGRLHVTLTFESHSDRSAFQCELLASPSVVTANQAFADNLRKGEFDIAGVTFNVTNLNAIRTPVIGCAICGSSHHQKEWHTS